MAWFGVGIATVLGCVFCTLVIIRCIRGWYKTIKEQSHCGKSIINKDIDGIERQAKHRGVSDEKTYAGKFYNHQENPTDKLIQPTDIKTGGDDHSQLDTSEADRNWMWKSHNFLLDSFMDQTDFWPHPTPVHGVHPLDPMIAIAAAVGPHSRRLRG